MRKSKINFEISLDDDNVPDKIEWNATEKENQGAESTQAISVNIWDPNQKNTLRMDLWTKEMSTFDMKRFSIDAIGGIAQTLLNSTGDEYMSEEIHNLCEQLVKHVESEQNQNQQGGNQGA